MTLSTFPQAFDDEHKARTSALDWSDKDRNMFFYVISKTNGKYIVDVIGQPFSDEKVIGVYYQAQLQA